MTWEFMSDHQSRIIGDVLLILKWKLGWRLPKHLAAGRYLHILSIGDRYKLINVNIYTTKYLFIYKYLNQW